MSMRTPGLVLGLVLVAGVCQAQPAPWHKWESSIDGRHVCAQTSPGQGWKWASGPYRDLNCTRAGRPGTR